ncbi:hypothetical protein AWB61_16830 [Chromobacterium sp. F49]|nr:MULTISPECIES: hypothetical protein [Chromobacterium]KUM02246.1 hypothetical protein Cv017_03765 [Chromobacterium subtsugae]KZE86201.1 hypothetical protein AWB61_16830 [Chromobacterium sp. F49]MBW7568048.1 hypothetical protein [Chromobacterium subtsugae]WSE91960.1 hypothetical protein U6115_01580 [Chromobacterium subtsugae]WVH60334.1 hypothetical protein U6151_01580 [Chromobacterium subtsugae]
MTRIAGQLSPEQLKAAQDQAAAIPAAAKPAIAAGQFVYFAAFDGTSNDKDKLSRGMQSTNAAQLYQQVAQAAKTRSDIGFHYFSGPGTAGTLPGSAFLPPAVTAEAARTANLAYDDFQKQASTWLKSHPGGSVAVAAAAFSRGNDAASVFAQLLYERGLTDPGSGKMLVPPGQLGLSAAVLYDPVMTGMSGNMAFPPNSRNLLILRAEHEYRSMFQAADFSAQRGAVNASLPGNHCDVGGGYDNGLGALALQAGTGFLQKAGLAIADVPQSRRFDPRQPALVHDEGVNQYGQTIWTTYGSYDQDRVARRTDQVARQAEVSTANGVTTTRFNDFSGKRVQLEQSQGPAGPQGVMTIQDYFNGSTSRVAFPPSAAAAPAAALSPAKQTLLQQARQAVEQLCQRDKLPFNAGQRDNIAAALGHAAWQQGLGKAGFALLHDGQSRISLLHPDSAPGARPATLELAAAALKPAAQSLLALAQSPDAAAHGAEAKPQILPTRRPAAAGMTL